MYTPRKIGPDGYEKPVGHFSFTITWPKELSIDLNYDLYAEQWRALPTTFRGALPKLGYKYCMSVECTRAAGSELQRDPADASLDNPAEDNMHFQGTCWRPGKAKHTVTVMSGLLKELVPHFHVYVAKSVDVGAADRYVIKKDATFRHGPFVDSDESLAAAEHKMDQEANVKAAEAKIRGVTLNQCQRDIMDWINTFVGDDRSILNIVSKPKMGKSLLQRYLAVVKKHMVVKYLPDEAKMHDALFTFGPCRVYHINIEFNQSDRFNVNNMKAFLEQVKDGILEKTRYKHEQIMQSPPIVVVYSNRPLPPYDNGNDRIKYGVIEGDKIDDAKFRSDWSIDRIIEYFGDPIGTSVRQSRSLRDARLARALSAVCGEELE